MEPRLSILAITLCLLGTVTSFPRPQVASRCAATCSGSQNNFKYEVGKSYVYDYESFTKLELGTENNNGPKVLIKASAQISVLAPCELALRLTEVRVSGPLDTAEFKRALEANPLLFSFDEGRIADVCEGFGDEQWVINLKKGLLSSLQVSAIEGDSKLVTETDVMGDCETRYEIMDRSYRGIRVKKSKDMKTCGRRHSAVGSLFPSSYASPDFAVQSLPVLGNEFSCELLVAQGIVSASRCVDKNSFLPLSWAPNSRIETTTELKLKEHVNHLLVSVPTADLNRHQLLFASNPMPLKTKTETEVKQLLTKICSKIQDEIEPEVPQLFGELVHSLRALPEVAVGRIYQLVERRSICSSPKLMDIFSDALIMDSSAGSLKLLSEMVLSGSMSKPMSDYLLTMLAFANRPSEAAIEALLPVLESRTPSRQAMLGVSALIHNFCVQSNCDGNRVVRRAANAILAQVGRRCNGEQAVVALKALANIGVPEFEVEKVLSCLGASPSDVEIAALESLEGVCDRKTMAKAMEMLKTSRFSPEVRIHAYKVLISCPSRQVIDEIVELMSQERCDQLIAFIGSHLKNVQKSSDPKKAPLRELLVPVTVPQFQKDIRRFSRHFELSHLFERANMGGVMDTEVIYDHSFVPRSLVFNVTIPAFGKSFNFVELGVRQVGLESKIESFFGPHGALRSAQVPDFVKKIVGSIRPPPAVSPKQNLVDHVFKGHQMKVEMPEQMAASMYIKLDGKTIFFVDEKDVPEQRGQFQAVASKLQLDKMKRFLSGRKDAAMSFMFMDNEHVFAASNGMPLKIALNGTAIVGYKSSETQLTPSFAAQMSAKITFDMKNSEQGIKWIGAASASPSIRFELNENKLRLSLPKNKVPIVGMSSKIVILDGQRSERMLNTIPSQTNDVCSGSFLDMKLCAKVVTPRTPWNSVESLAGNWELDWNVQKQGADALEFTLELPSARDSRKMYKLAFATPGGRVNRDTYALVAFELEDPQRQEIKMEFKCPMRSMKMHALKVMTEENALVKLTSIINEQDTYEVEAALDTIRRGRKVEWKPRVALVLPGQSPKSMSGSLSLDEGRKTRVSIRLTSHTGTEIIRGTLVKDGSLDGRFKFSADVAAELGILNIRLFGAAHKTDASISNDISIEYSTPSHRRPQSAKLVAKVQNLSTRSLKKLTSFLEITSTEFPSTNFHINWNLLFKPLEHVENEGIIMWGNDFRDPNRKIKVLQVTKLSGFSSDGLKTVENMLSVDIRPLRIDYELQLNGHVEKGELPKFKLETRAHERRARKEYSAGAEYSTLSKTPLRLSMAAHVKVPSVADVHYTDSITESSPGEYHGQSGLKWASNKQAKLDYFYRIKSNQQKTHHELDWSFEHPALVAPLHHQALLRLTRHELEVRSKANSGASEIWEAKAELNKRGNSEVYLNTNSMSGKLSTNPFATPSTHSIEVVGKSGKPFSHRSNLELTRNSIALNSKTIHDSKPILVLNSNLADRGMSRFSVDTTPFKANVEFNPSPMTGSILLSTDRNVHKSAFSADSNSFDMSSKTQSNGNLVANIQGSLKKRGASSLNMETSRWTGRLNADPEQSTSFEVNSKVSDYTHRTDIAPTRHGVKFTSKTMKNQKQLLGVDSTISSNDGSYLTVDTVPVSGHIQVDPVSYEKTLNLKLVDHRQPREHVTEIKLHPKRVTLMSKTVSDGASVARVDGGFDSLEHHHIKVNTPVTDVAWLRRRHQAKLSLVERSSGIDHNTELELHPMAYNLLSKTSQHGRQVALVKGQMSDELKQLRVQVPNAEAALKMSPKKTEIELQGADMTHKTVLEMAVPQTMTIDSQTTKNGRDFLTINSKLSRRSDSHFNVIAAPIRGSLKVSPWSQVKTLEFDGQHEGLPLVHRSKVILDPMSISLDSNTDYQRRPVFNIGSKLSRRSDSHFNVIAAPIRGSLKVNPWSEVKTLEFEGQHEGLPLVHKSKLVLDPTSISLDSNTDYQRQPALTIGTKLSRSERSFVNIKQHPSMEASFEVDPFAETQNGRFQLKKDRFETWTKVNYSPERYVAMESESKSHGANILSFDSKLSGGDSHFKVNTKKMNGALRVSAARIPRSISLDVSGRTLKHKSEIKMVPSESLDFESQTHDNGRQVADIRSRISRQGVSKLNVDIEPLRASLEVDPNAWKKRVEYEVEYKKSGVTHASTLHVVPDSLVELRSSADRHSEPIYKFVADYKPKMASLKLESQHLDSNVKLEPEEASFELKGKKLMTGHVHKTILKMSRNNFIVESRTSKHGQNIAAIDSVITSSAPSTLKIQSTLGNADVALSPFGSRKTARWTLNGQQLSHDLDAVCEPKQLELNTVTRHMNKNILKVETKLQQRGDSFLAVDNQLFDGRVDMKPAERLVQVDYTAKHGVRDRRILGSVQNNDKLIMDVAWDKDRNSDARLKLTLDTQGRSDKHHVDLKAEYGSEHFVTIRTHLTKRSALAGPHDIEIDVNIPRHPVKIILHHEMADGKMNCVARYIRDDEEKIELRNVANYQYSRSGGYSLNGEVTIKSVYQYLDNMRFKVNSELSMPSRGSIDSKMALVIQLPNESPFELDAVLQKNSNWKGGSMSGSLKAVTPIYDYKNQELSVRSTWTQEKFDIEQNLVALGKSAKLQGEFALTRDGFESKLNVDSEFEMIPKLAAESRMASTAAYSSKFEMKADSDRVELVNVDASIDLKSMSDFSGEAMLSTKWTPKFEAQLEGKLNSRTMKYAFEAKQNGRAVAEMKVDGQQSRANVEGQAFVTIGSEKIVDITLNARNGQMYTLNVEATGNRQIKFTFEPKKVGSKNGFLFSVCPRGSPCASFEAIYSDPQSNSMSNMNQEIKLTFKRASTEYGFDWAIVMNGQKTVNRMMVDWNGKRLGFSMKAVNSYSGHGELLAQVFLPQRVMEFRGVSVARGDRNQVTIDLLTDAENHPRSKLNIEWIHNDQVNQYSRAIESSLKINHPVLRRPLVSTFSFEQNESRRSRPLAAQLILDLAANPKQKLIFEASVAHPGGDARNTSLTFGIHRPDRRSLDFSSSIHVGLNEDIFTNGMEWSWMSRSNQKVQGFYFVEANARNQAIHVISRCPLTNLDVQGNWAAAHDNQGLSFSGFVKLNGVQRRATITALTSKPGCVQMTLFKERDQMDKKWEFCANFEKIGKQFVKLSAANLADQSNEDDVSATFFQQSPKAYRFALKWQPEAFGQMMKAAMNAAESVDIRMPNTNEMKEKIFGEGRREVVDKVNNVAHFLVNDILEPSKKSFSAEAKKIAEELDIDETVLEPVYATLSTFKDFIAQILNAILPNNMDTMIEDVLESINVKMAALCARNEVCSSLAYKYERHGWQGVRSELIQKFDYRFDSVEWMKKKMDELFNGPTARRFNEMVMNMSHEVSEQLQVLMERIEKAIIKFDQEMLRSESLAEPYKMVRELAMEAKKDAVKMLDQVEWDELEKFYLHGQRMFTSTDFWRTRARFVTWNPQNGEIVLEVRSPVQTETLKSIVSPYKRRSPAF